ncbi:MAG: threonine synthase [Armatimonadetes bacterium]|nr:threonine synthase [Armatimonadota bacterium]
MVWQCHCGSPLLWLPRDDLRKTDIRLEDWTLWRYRAFLALPPNISPVSLGEGTTPMMATPDGRSRLKLEFLNPTGSFKDRGASVLVSVLKAGGVTEVAEDSSGNAGVALAASCRAAEIKCHIFVPQTSSPGKLAALREFGAVIHPAKDRTEASEAVLHFLATGAAYASHTWHPYYLQGTKTVAYEIAEQMDWSIGPDLGVFIPVGNGDLLLGMHLGFQEMLLSGLIEGLPRLHCVQAEACAPICNAVYGWDLPISTTVAEGVAVPSPPRVHQIVQAVRETGGDFIAVPESAILNAQCELRHLGLWTEPTGAIAFAAWDLSGRPDESILLLTGAGWKTLGSEPRGETRIVAEHQTMEKEPKTISKKRV